MYLFLYAIPNIILPFSNKLLSAVEKGLNNQDTVKKVSDDFRSMVESIKGVTKDLIDYFL